MKLNSLLQYKKKSDRVGRGHSGGQGKTSGRGHKGQKARSGKKLRPGFEGGQTPLFQRLPKYRGFKNPNHVVYQIVNVKDLERLTEKSVTRKTLHAAGLIGNLRQPVKLLGEGELNKAFTVMVEKASQSALQKITAAGGTFTAPSNAEQGKSENESAEPTNAPAPKKSSPRKKAAPKAKKSE